MAEQTPPPRKPDGLLRRSGGERSEGPSADHPHGSTLPIRCSFCGLEGQVVSGSDQLASTLSAGFHLEENRISGHDKVIVCNACDEILID